MRVVQASSVVAAGSALHTERQSQRQRMENEINLTRHDIQSVGATARHCLIVVPGPKGTKQRYAVGDQSGTVLCAEVNTKKNAIEVVFKNPAGKRDVTAMSLGGKKNERDKLFVAFGTTIQGINSKKGKPFFTFNTSLNEDINNLFVEDTYIWSTCDFILNNFQESKDMHFFMSSDKINHFVCANVTSDKQYNVVLACRDKYVRVIKDADCLYSARVDGPVSAISRFTGAEQLSFDFTNTDGGDDRKKDAKTDGTAAPATASAAAANYKHFVYGTENGQFGSLALDNTSAKRGWTVLNDRKKGGIQVVNQVDILHSGVPELVVGRDDGSLEVYRFSAHENPSLVFSSDLSESITAIDSGAILSNTNENELILSTYSGKIVCFSTEVSAPLGSLVASGKDSKDGAGGGMMGVGGGIDPTKAAAAAAETAKAVAALQREIDELKAQVRVSKERYSKVSTELIAVEQQFKIKDSFRLLPDEACYVLTVEIQMPIDVVTLQSNVRVISLDVLSQNATVSFSPPDAKNGNELMATCKCQDATNRLEIKIRTVEGQHGVLNAYIIPKQSPKTCQKSTFQIKPLSLHERVTPQTIEASMSRPLTTLTMTGAFTLNDVHLWVSSCLPDVPPKLTSDEVKLCFRSTFLHTILVCDYGKGKGTFQSDSVTVISILKEVLTRSATDKKVAVGVDLKLNTDSVFSFLDLLKPALDHHFALARKHSLIEPLREISQHEDDITYLHSDYLDILKGADGIKAEIKTAPRQLDFLRGIVTDLFLDMHKLDGRRAQTHVPKLMEVLNQYNFPALVAAFKMPL